MHKRRLYCRILGKGALVLVVPSTAFLVLTVWLFPPRESWGWVIRTLEVFGGWTMFVAAVVQLWGVPIPKWIGLDLLRILRAFEARTELTLNSIRDTLPVLDSRLDRGEVREVWRILEQGNLVLLTGESGSGKSGVAAAIVRRAKAYQMPCLFLDTRRYSLSVSTSGDLERFVDVDLPLRVCLQRFTDEIGGCLIVIDQLDSAVGTPAFQVSIDLLATAALLEGVKTLAISCVSDTPEHMPIRDLRFTAIGSRPLKEVAPELTAALASIR